MRFKIFSFVLFSWLFVNVAPVQATIFHINNQTGTSNGSNGIYAQPSDAHDVALPGDTLLIDGGPNKYGSLSMTKRLVVMGPGYFQDENPNTNTFSARIGQINLYQESGGGASSGAAGSIIQGLDLGEDFPGVINVDVSDVIVRKNRLKQVEVYWPATIAWQVHNVIVMQNYFVDNGSVTHIEITFNGLLRDAQIRNNIFEGIVEIPDLSKADFLNNIFISPQFTIENLDGVVRNNVFLSNSPTYTLSADSITHNISMGAGLPAGNGNILNAVSADVFVLNTTQNGSDGQYQLAASSSALGAGYQGVDIGPFGGISTYIKYGIGEIPVIWFMNVNGGLVNPGQPLPVSIRAVSGN